MFFEIYLHVSLCGDLPSLRTVGMILCVPSKVGMFLDQQPAGTDNSSGCNNGSGHKTEKQHVVVGIGFRNLPLQSIGYKALLST